MIYHLFLPDFRSYVKNTAFTSEDDRFPIFYFEEEFEISFYKTIEDVTFILELPLEGLPDDITIEGLKREFQSIELPKKPNAPTIISGTITR